jgi:hypothetical protein
MHAGPSDSDVEFVSMEKIIDIFEMKISRSSLCFPFKHIKVVFEDNQLLEV